MKKILMTSIVVGVFIMYASMYILMTLVSPTKLISEVEVWSWLLWGVFTGVYFGYFLWNRMLSAVNIEKIVRQLGVYLGACIGLPVFIFTWFQQFLFAVIPGVLLAFVLILSFYQHAVRLRKARNSQ